MGRKNAGLTYKLRETLEYIREYSPNVSIPSIAHELGISNTAAGSRIDRLEKLGYIRKEMKDHPVFGKKPTNGYLYYVEMDPEEE